MNACMHEHHISTPVSLYTFDMSRNKYDCLIMLGGYINPAFVYTSANTQLAEISTSHVIAMYIPTTNIPLKCHICQLLHMNIWYNMPQMNSLQSTVGPGALLYTPFTLLEYAPEQISLPHYKYMFHCTATVVYI